MPKRILLTTTGSLGDLHPIMAIGLALLARGHLVTLATSNIYRQKVEHAGLKFAPMGPHLSTDDIAVMHRVMDRRRGPEYLIRKIICPSVPAAYAEVLPVAEQADIIVTHPITYASQIAAEKIGMPWVSTVTAPFTFCSRFDPPVIPSAQFLAKLRPFGPIINGLVIALGQAVTHRWMKSITSFRRSIGLPPGRNPIFEGQHSPQCVLAMFCAEMAQPQPDWPAQTHVTGFPFYDQAGIEQDMDPDLERFLDAGPAPVVFTLGSSAVNDPGAFYRGSMDAVRKLGCRAVLLVGNNQIAGPIPPEVAVVPYAPFSRVLPRASAIVHQCGIGTCGQALAAGKPMLAVPYAFDQPDNAARLERIGVARVIARNRYTSKRAAGELDHLLSNSAYAEKAAAVARLIAQEDGAERACDAILNLAASDERRTSRTQAESA